MSVMRKISKGGWGGSAGKGLKSEEQTGRSQTWRGACIVAGHLPTLLCEARDTAAPQILLRPTPTSFGSLLCSLKLSLLRC